MMTRLTTGLTACLVMSLYVGCTSSPGLIRGQSPVVTQPSTSTVVMPQEELPFPFNNRVAGHLRDQVRAGTPDYCPDCYRNGVGPHWDGQKWCNGDGTPYYGWAPTHTYQHQYWEPRNLVYPDANAQAGVVVYPYYTHKGPDDFFLK